MRFFVLLISLWAAPLFAQEVAHLREDVAWAEDCVAEAEYLELESCVSQLWQACRKEAIDADSWTDETDAVCAWREARAWQKLISTSLENLPKVMDTYPDEFGEDLELQKERFELGQEAWEQYRGHYCYFEGHRWSFGAGPHQRPGEGRCMMWTNGARYMQLHRLLIP